MDDLKLAAVVLVSLIAKDNIVDVKFSTLIWALALSSTGKPELLLCHNRYYNNAL